MYSSTSKFLQVADVLEKCASYFEQEEVAHQEKRAAELKSTFINPIRDSGANIDSALEEKLAHTDPDVLNLLKSLSVDRASSDDDYSLGGPTEKTASDSSDDDALLAFCMDD